MSSQQSGTIKSRRKGKEKNSTNSSLAPASSNVQSLYDPEGSASASREDSRATGAVAPATALVELEVRRQLYSDYDFSERAPLSASEQAQLIRRSPNWV